MLLSRNNCKIKIYIWMHMLFCTKRNTGNINKEPFFEVVYIGGGDERRNIGGRSLWRIVGITFYIILTFDLEK